MLTGYGNIATAVTAVKLGAVDYLAKPADADDVYQALIAPEDAKALRATVSTFPKSGYDLEEVLTQLGTGEAVITVLSERGAPPPVARPGRIDELLPIIKSGAGSGHDIGQPERPADLDQLTARHEHVAVSRQRGQSQHQCGRGVVDRERRLRARRRAQQWLETRRAGAAATARPPPSRSRRPAARRARRGRRT